MFNEYVIDNDGRIDIAMRDIKQSITVNNCGMGIDESMDDAVKMVFVSFGGNSSAWDG